jgi:thioredoxin-like negative regulator of GroEL
MSVTIFDIPVAVLVWTQEGCPACEQYLPKLRKIAEKYSQCVPTIIADVNQFPNAADAFRVSATPYTVISRYGRPPAFAGFADGDVDEGRIESIYASAVTGAECAV